ncbi:Brix-domain-containing protein [Rhizodiscina lignyota]|uniref:Brix-domain-containing protein n=1 Tax=Rhizodiscina lignyota TaxID=1504668 RepID=A0A9P4M6Y3_9PEZI|nr:Brix-domain-containing protein [Rhizodiscina lignyota]
MASKRLKLGPKAHLPFKTANKVRRQQLHIKRKQALDGIKRKERFGRKREEEKDPRLKENRLAQNVPVTIDKKRVWDDVVGDEGDELGLSIDVERLKRRKMEEEEQERQMAVAESPIGAEQDAEDEEGESDVDSMLEDTEDEDEDDQDKEGSSDSDADKAERNRTSSPPAKRATSPSGSTMSTRLDLTPEALAAKFPTLFAPPPDPKILITTSINSTLHTHAELLTELFPNSTYIRRSAHRYGHKYSVREISKFAANRGYTTLLVLNEDQKLPCGLDIVHLPHGPMFHFALKNWIEGKKLPGHGNPTNHYPELILNNFRTPLGLLTAHLFRTMFPPQPELHGRQVVTLHNQRDYVFFRRHRYVFRDRKSSEKSIVGTDGKPVKGVEDIRAGLQELGPRFTLKLRRVDRGIQRSSGQEWEWKAGSEKVRTRFQL